MVCSYSYAGTTGMMKLPDLKDVNFTICCDDNGGIDVVCMEPNTMLPVFDLEAGLISIELASLSMCTDTMRVSTSLPLEGLGSGNTVAVAHMIHISSKSS